MTLGRLFSEIIYIARDATIKSISIGDDCIKDCGWE